MSGIFASLWQSGQRSSGNKRSNRAHRPGARLGLEFLEDRAVPSAGMLDPTFGNGGAVITNSPSSNRDGNFTADSVAIQADGKIIVAEDNDTSGALVAIRFNRDGTLDSSFGPNHNGFVSLAGLGGSEAVAVPPDGKILLAGNTFPSSFGGDFAVVRLNSDGSRDTTFGDGGNGVQLIDFSSPGGMVFAQLTGMAIQPAGSTDYKVVLAGYASFGGGPPFVFFGAVARLNSDGSLDNSFNSDGEKLGSDAYFAVAPQSDKILLDTGHSLIRLNNNGSLDTTSFGNAGVQPTFGEGGMTVQSDGKIVLAGPPGVFNTAGQMSVERLSSNGSLDTGFGNSGQEIINFNNDFVLSGGQDAGAIQLEQQGLTVVEQEVVAAGANAVAVQPDGKIVVAGDAGPAFIGQLYRADGTFQGSFTDSYSRSAVVRLNSDGSLDTSFGSGGKQIIDFGGGEDPGGSGEAFSAVAIQPDGNLVLTGTTNHAPGYSLVTARYLGGAINVTTQAAVASQLNQIIATANQSGQPDQVTFQVSTQANVDTMLTAVNALPAATAPVTVVLDLGGGTYSTDGITVNPPANVSLVIQNGTLDPSSPALTVAGGNVSVLNCTLLTTADVPTILVTGGRLTLRNDTVQESTGFSDPAIAIGGGSVDLGTIGQPGHNTFNVNGTGFLIKNTGANPVSALAAR
jgi:uncharacterized delta-60 repeat protein